MKHLANDGQYYSDKQYIQAAELVKAHQESQGKEPLPIMGSGHWWVVGAIAGYLKDGTPFEFYMRDLVLGIVRTSYEGHDDYFEAVDLAGIV